jgi:L,D-transpeptidase ErfK/SrfK
MKLQMEKNSDLVGKITIGNVTLEDNLPKYAVENYLGFSDIQAANPDLDLWFPEESDSVVLPTQFILPNVAKEGIVINLSEYRLYYFPKNNPNIVYTYPIGIGREGWKSPVGVTKITTKIPNPTWTPPKSIVKEAAEQGETLPAIYPPGPDNPLGVYKMNLSLPGYLIHGTNKEYGIGLRVSHGCFRMDNEHVVALANMIDIGTPVNIISQPYKLGFKNGLVYLEAHRPLSDSVEAKTSKAKQQAVLAALKQNPRLKDVNIDWDKAANVLEKSDGIPTPIMFASK